MALTAGEILILIKARDDASRTMNRVSGAADKMGKVVRRAAIGGGVALAGMTVAGGIAATKMAIDFESAFADVRKTVSATEPVLEELRNGIRRMSTEVPESATAIAGVAAAAGQLGIAVPNILAFTRVMVDLGNTTNLSSTEAATSLARLANITQMPQDQFDRLGSTVVALGNNLATTEAEIVSMGLRLAGAGEQAGFTEAQILSIAGALSSMGLSAEAGGTAMSRVILEMNKAVASGSEELTTFAALAGQSIEDFARSFEEDAMGALLSFFEGLGGLSDAELFAVLEKLGFENVRIRDTILRTAGAQGVLADAVDIGTKAWADNTALTAEAAQRYETTASKLKIAWNNVVNLGIELGAVLLPALVDVLEATNKFVGALVILAGNFDAVNEAQLRSALGILEWGRTVVTVMQRAAQAVETSLAIMTGGLSLLAEQMGFIPDIVGSADDAVALFDRRIAELNQRLLWVGFGGEAAAGGVESIASAATGTSGAVGGLDSELGSLDERLGAVGASIDREFNDPILEARELVSSLRQELFRLISMPTVESAAESVELFQLRLSLLQREEGMLAAVAQRQEQIAALEDRREGARRRRDAALRALETREERTRSSLERAEAALQRLRERGQFLGGAANLVRQRRAELQEIERTRGAAEDAFIAERDAIDAEIDAVREHRTAVERDSEAIQKQIDVLQRLAEMRRLETSILAAQLDVADQTLLTDEELTDALERLIASTADLTGEIVEQVGDIRSQWIPALDDAASSAGGVSSSLGGMTLGFDAVGDAAETAASDALMAFKKLDRELQKLDPFKYLAPLFNLQPPILQLPPPPVPVPTPPIGTPLPPLPPPGEEIGPESGLTRSLWEDVNRFRAREGLPPIPFHQGGIVPGVPGQEVLALLRPKEEVRTEAQQRGSALGSRRVEALLERIAVAMEQPHRVTYNIDQLNVEDTTEQALASLGLSAE